MSPKSAIFFVFIFWACLILPAPAWSESKEDWICARDSTGQLFFQKDEYDPCFILSTTPIPPRILNKLVEAINFAFQEDAAREISPRDLFHAHLLYYLVKYNAPMDSADALLLHTQEWVRYPSWEKRNILAWLTKNSPIQILKTEVRTTYGYNTQTGKYDMPQPYYTVFPVDLNMVNPVSIIFLEASAISETWLANYKSNIRQVSGRPVLFGIPRFIIK